MAVSVTEANLGAICVQSTLYGIFLVLSCTALVLLVDQRNRELTALSSATIAPSQSLWSVWKSPLFVTTVVLFVMVTVQWVISVYRAFDGFIYFEGGQAPTQYFLDLKRWAELTVIALMLFTQVICDGMITYRTWIVWNRDWRVVAFPLVALLALTAGCIGLAHQMTVQTNQHNVYAQAMDRWIIADSVLTLCINVYGTGMISFRIWSATRNMKSMRAPSDHLLRVFAIFIESAALYTSWSLFFFITYKLRSALHYPGSNCWPQVSGIAYMLITVRIGLGWAHKGSSMGYPPHAAGGAVHAGSGGGGQQTYPLQTISFNVTQTVEQETDYAISPKEDKGQGRSFLADV